MSGPLPCVAAVLREGASSPWAFYAGACSVTQFLLCYVHDAESMCTTRIGLGAPRTGRPLFHAI
jgi:hypothetical protein